MFAENRSLKKIDTHPAEIITLLVSTNRPMVALSGPPQQADAFIVSVDRGKTQPVYLCFHIVNGERLIYTSNTVPTSESARARLEEEALRFAEDMGFMMVRESFDGLLSEQRDDAVMGLAPFVDDVSQIRHRETRDEKRERHRAARAAESEVEYEDVYEEVEEEVAVEEEPPKPEEYESLSDVVTEVSAQEAHRPAADGSEKARKRGSAPVAVETAESNEEAFDLGKELSDMVETIRENPERRRTAQKSEARRPRPAERVIERPKQSEPEPLPSMEVLPEKWQAIIKLIISL